MKANEPNRPVDPAWAKVHNAALELRISELREAVKLIERRIAELEAEKLK